MSAIIEQWAGHYEDRTANSDKVWAGAFDDTGCFYSTWGRRGSSLMRGSKPFGSVEAARKEYQKKVGEKQREGYQTIPFDDPRYGVKSFGATANPAPTPANTPASKPTVYRCTHLTPISEADLKRCIVFTTNRVLDLQIKS